MNKHELTFLMTSLGMSPSKKMGQNFLIDENFMDWMGREANVQPGQRILEVGPGFGSLTAKIMAGGAELVSIEFDRKLCEWLKKNVVPKGLRLVEGDACRVDIEAIFGKGVSFRFISNLPYSCGSVIIAKLLELETPPIDMMVMLQKEVAQRMTAPADSSSYGSLSVRAQVAYAVEIIKSVPPNVFHPKPEIDSAIVRFRPRQHQMPCHAERLLLSQMSRVAFSKRRKKMFKQIAAIFGEEAVTKAMSGASVDPDIRAEKVTVRQFARMASLLVAWRAEHPEEAKAEIQVPDSEEE